jgi:alkanesulfonate monooxygenase SsuD/methylene tetrahydromethanopterin reductase-like flavin-dependent oxidoreductase (luciferase family)
VGIGSSIINIYSRTPSSIAMGAATVDIISKGKLILGLGTSSSPIIEDFHGIKFENQLQRMREYVEIINQILSGNQINYTGKIFQLKNFTLLVKPYRKKIPIYLAAVNQKMVNLAWEISNGVIFYLRPLTEMRKTIPQKQSKKKIDVTCQIISSVSDDEEMAINRAKKTLAFYISVGKIYREFLAKNGFSNEINNIYGEFSKSGFKSNYELIPEKMLKELTIAGTPEQCRQHLLKFRDVGIDMPIIQFNPVGDVVNSFKMFMNTFSDES